jgi:hypothetical protein
MNACWAAQMAFVLGGFLGQDVALERLAALNAATWANAKTFLRAALGLHFGHDCSEIYSFNKLRGVLLNSDSKELADEKPLYGLRHSWDLAARILRQAHDFTRFLSFLSTLRILPMHTAMTFIGDQMYGRSSPK